ncbi:hypothetical protein AHF37_05788 [Paragonimus kellicotti]|nr:hypothetical protein AHF37_05788 [Paragonimus kellicotti]
MLGDCDSRVLRFVINVDGVVCINPGHVSRGQSSGSYACMRIQSGSDDIVDIPEQEIQSDSTQTNHFTSPNCCVTVNRL